MERVTNEEMMARTTSATSRTTSYVLSCAGSTPARRGKARCELATGPRRRRSAQHGGGLRAARRRRVDGERSNSDHLAALDLDPLSADEEGQFGLIKPNSSENGFENDENGENDKVAVIARFILVF
uniref:Uncharacterized protein n=1 Tax=Oryza sativa subsp. japonica TaxID=39947 RepID=Q6H888_ORYSJ|nr:hypothetical protein [Oryza sativa Japonica Group]